MQLALNTENGTTSAALAPSMLASLEASSHAEPQAVAPASNRPKMEAPLTRPVGKYISVSTSTTGICPDCTPYRDVITSQFACSCKYWANYEYSMISSQALQYQELLPAVPNESEVMQTSPTHAENPTLQTPLGKERPVEAAQKVTSTKQYT